MSSLLTSTTKTYPASLLLRFDGSFSDSSINNHNIINPNNGVVINTSTKKYGSGSADFTSGSLLIASNSLFAFPSDFTIEGWFYFLGNNNGYQPLICADGDAPDSAWALILENNNTLAFYGSSNENSWDLIANTSYIPPINQWIHIVVTRKSGVLFFYVNGFYVPLTSSSGTSNSIMAGSTVTIGGYNYFPNISPITFTGYIDDIRIVKGVSIYQNQFSPPSGYLSRNASVEPVRFNHIVMTSTKSSGDISGYVTTSTGYYTVNWYDGTKTTYVSGTNFAKIAVGGSQYITIYPSLSNGYMSGLFINVNVTNNSLSNIRAFYSKFGRDFGSFINPPPVWNRTRSTWYNNGYTGYTKYYGYFYTAPPQYIAGPLCHLDIGYNSLDATALNQLYTDLLDGVGTIDVSDNPGGDSDDPTIASAKGYTVYGSFSPILSALFNFDGTNNSTTFTDSSSYNHAPTRYGDTKISTTQSKFGGSSAYFDGTGDYLAIPSNSVFAMGKDDFTIECWVYPTSLPTSDLGAIIENRSSASSGGFLLWLGSDQKWVLYTSANSNGTQRVVSSIDNAVLNTWTHLAGVRLNGKLYLFVNGSLVGTDAVENDPDDLSPSNTAPIRIGTAIDSPGTTRMFYGYIDGLKIVKGKALYLDDFVVPSSAPTTSTSTISSGITRLLLNCNGTNNSTTFTDSSSDARTITRTNTVISTTQSKFGGASAYFSNSGTDALAVTNTFNLSECDYTIEFWFYLINQSGSTDNQRLFSIEKSGESWGILLAQTTPNFASYNHYGTSSGFDLNNTSFSYNTWYHFAMTKDKNTYRSFLNGSQIGIGVGSYTPTGNVVITIGGSRLNYQYNKLNAYIDDFRVITGKALYTSNFTTPSSQLTVYP